MNKIARGAVSAMEIAGSLCGVPFVGAAAVVLREIVVSCEEVVAHKKKSKQMTQKCALLLNTLNEQASRLEGSELQQTADEVTAVLQTINGRVRQWSRYSRVQMWWKNAEIGKGLDKCDRELDVALSQFQINAQIILQWCQRDTMDTIRSNADELRELMFQMLNNQAEMQRIVEMQNAGERVAESIMGAGQMELRHLREGTASYELMVADVRSLSPTPQPSPIPQLPHIPQRSSTPQPSPIPQPSDSQRYLQYQRGLIQLHRATGIPPTVKVLNGEVEKTGDLAVAGGTYSDIWQGVWMGEDKVALKALRNIKATDPKARKRFEHEITVWADLTNDHILPFYGIVTDQGQHIHMVSPWQENGNVLDYVRLNPDADRIRLISGAAQGLEYLHSRNIIHGNVKCANILVSASGDACICDFGMSKVIEEVTEKSASATLTASGSARWLAPELIEGVVSSPTKAADTYSYAMAILELLTGKHPFSDRKRDASVIHDIVVLKKTPLRPVEEEVSKWLSDELWDLMQKCWCNEAVSRPSMAQVAACVDSIENSDAMDTS